MKLALHRVEKVVMVQRESDGALVPDPRSTKKLGTLDLGNIGPGDLRDLEHRLGKCGLILKGKPEAAEAPESAPDEASGGADASDHGEAQEPAGDAQEAPKAPRRRGRPRKDA